MSTARPASLGAITVITAAAMFGSLGVLTRFAYDAGMEPFAFVAWRFVVGALAVWTGIILVRRPMRLRAGFAALGSSGRGWLLLAIAVGTTTNLAIFLALDTTTVALALLGFYTYPAMVAVGSAVLGRDRLDALRIAAVLLALVGMAAVVLGGPNTIDGADGQALGIAFALGAALSQTVFILISRGYASLPSEQAMGTILAGSSVLALIIALAIDGIAALALPFGQPQLLLLMLVVGIFPAGLGSVMFLVGLRWIGPVRTGILMLFEPVVGVVLAALLLQEGLAPMQVVGGVTILVAALLVQRGSAGEQPAAVTTVPAPGGP